MGFPQKAVPMTPRLPSISFVSLGCSKNLVDSEVLLGRVLEDGFVLCQDPADSDIVLVNTCGFLEASRQESLAAIRQMVELKKLGGPRGVVVVGCMVQKAAERIKAEAPGVDGFLGLFEQDRIAEVCRGIWERSGAGKTVPSAASRRRRGDPISLVGRNDAACQADRARLRLTPRHTAYVKISEGCDNKCTFCVIPQIRGPHRSKPIDVVLEEVHELVADGAVEINLIAQDSTDYGRDLYGRRNLAELLRALSRVEGLRWIRLLYAYPAYMTEEMIDVIAEEPRIVKYVDIPLQHITDRMLGAMRRYYNRKRAEWLVGTLRGKVPGIALRTTIIVGFPGETEEDFEELLRFLRETRFERLGAFRYSREEGTPSHDMPDQIPEEVKAERYSRLMDEQREILFAANRDLVGRELEILVDEEDSGEPERFLGRTYRDAPEVDCSVRLSAVGIRPGQFVTARVTDTDGYDLLAEAR